MIGKMYEARKQTIARNEKGQFAPNGQNVRTVDRREQQDGTEDGTFQSRQNGDKGNQYTGQSGDGQNVHNQTRREQQGGQIPGSAQNGHTMRTADSIAQELGVGKETVKRAGKFAQGVDALKAVSPEAAEKVLQDKQQRPRTQGFRPVFIAIFIAKMM